MTDGRGGVPQDDLAVVLRAHEVAEPAPAFRNGLRERLMSLEVPVVEEPPPDAPPATGQWTGLAPLVAGGLVVVMAIILSRAAPWGPGGWGTDSPAPPSGAPEGAGPPAPVQPRGPSPNPVTPTEDRPEPTTQGPAATSTEASGEKEPPASIPASPTVTSEAPPDQPPPANRPPEHQRPPDQPAPAPTATVGPPPSTASPPPPPPSPTPLASPAPRPTATPIGLDPGAASPDGRSGPGVRVARARALGPLDGLGPPSQV